MRKESETLEKVKTEVAKRLPHIFVTFDICARTLEIHVDHNREFDYKRGIMLLKNKNYKFQYLMNWWNKDWKAELLTPHTGNYLEKTVLNMKTKKFFSDCNFHFLIFKKKIVLISFLVTIIIIFIITKMCF